MNLQSNDFELFGLPATFAQDRALMDTRWKELQREAHPDKFAAQGGAAQRVAMHWSVRINEAYQRLKDPLKRGAYLCELNGVPIHAETNTSMPTEFLLKQLEWREALDDAKTAEDIEKIAFEVNKDGREQLLKVEQFIDGVKDFSAAAGQVRSMMFVNRFLAEVEAKADAFDALNLAAAAR
jgi:molecular chaperone HscB